VHCGGLFCELALSGVCISYCRVCPLSGLVHCCACFFRPGARLPPYIPYVQYIGPSLAVCIFIEIEGLVRKIISLIYPNKKKKNFPFSRVFGEIEMLVLYFLSMN